MRTGHGQRDLTEPETSGSRLARVIGVLGRDMTPKYWLNLQRLYDLDPAGEDADVSTIELRVGGGLNRVTEGMTASVLVVTEVARW